MQRYSWGLAWEHESKMYILDFNLSIYWILTVSVRALRIGIEVKWLHFTLCFRKVAKSWAASWEPKKKTRRQMMDKEIIIKIIKKITDSREFLCLVHPNCCDLTGVCVCQAWPTGHGVILVSPVKQLSPDGSFQLLRLLQSWTGRWTDETRGRRLSRNSFHVFQSYLTCIFLHH